MQHCLYCGHIVHLVHVHGHYQCPVCGTNALPCGDGDNCHTNQFFNQQENAGKETVQKTVPPYED